jgi:hypothetical protein
MSRQINFLAERRKTVSKQQLADQRSLKMALTVFGVVFTVFILVFGIRLFSEIQLRQIRSAKEVALAKISQRESTERQYLIFFQKIKALSDLAAVRQNKQAAIVYMTSVFQPFGLVNQIEFNEVDRVLSFVIEASDIFRLQQVFGVLKQDAFTQSFASVNTSNLLRSEDGKYQVKVTISTRKPVQAVLPNGQNLDMNSRVITPPTGAK